jgi:hypothetical protein
MRGSLLVIFGLTLLAGCARGEPPPASPPMGMGPNDSRAISGSDGSSSREMDKAKKTSADTPAPDPGGYVFADAQPGGGVGAGAPPPPPPPPPAKTAPAEHDDPGPQRGQQQQLNRDFVIYTAHFVMAVYQVEKGIAAVEKIAQDTGGYLSLKKDREITIRIPRAKFQAAVAAVDGVGDVLHRDIEAEDVTDEHVDTEIRIKNARAMQQHLTALLAKANVKEALEIEKELARVTQELELLEGRLKLLNDRIAFSTITVNFEPRGLTITTQRVRLPFPWLNTLNLPTLLQLNEEK